ncbi:N-formylglutamate amidohydrolase [Oleispirillum naphthae]|uniref:N-formylglutamate amidohydrolase n=1 Tax=Oleispirillum naphthae TaxID=2838853 RepID=UPI0030823323
MKPKPTGMGCGVFDNTLSERIGGVLEILYPDVQSLPLVLASPHSGCDYTWKFLESAQLGPLAIRRSEDAFVDRLFALGPKRGVPLIRALFPRAFLDVNREAYELDPEMFEDPLPPFVNAISPRAAIGLGTIPRIVGHNQPIYAGKLRFAEAQERIEDLYYPYHARLESLLRDTKRRFGACLLLDCHSMPTSPGEDSTDPFGPDVVLGDGFGATCDAEIADTAERVLSELGFVVARNRPYAGGFTTRHYGRPSQGTHALQIEIARRLYMNEETLTPLPCLPEMARKMAVLIDALGKLALPLAQLSGRSAEAAD